MADPVEIVATAKSETANSYVTLAQANTYFLGRLYVTDWTDAGNDTRNRALISAAERLDQEEYDAIKSDADQALKWPRDGLYDEDGNSVDSDTVPQRIKDAQCKLALYMLADDLLVDTGLEAFDNVKVGPMDVTPRHMRVAGELPADVRREIRFWLTTSRSTVQLVRG